MKDNYWFKIRSFFSTSTFGLYLMLFIILTIFNGIVWLLTKEGSMRYSILAVGSIVLVLFIWIAIEEYLGRKRHRNILETKNFQPLRDELHFSIEQLNNNKYNGYKGVYKSYFYRVFYDWNTSLLHPNLSHGVIVSLYYETISAEKVNQLTHEINNFEQLPLGGNCVVYENHLELKRRYNMFTRYKHIKSLIDFSCEIASKYSLSVILQTDVLERMKNNDSFSPNIITFWED